MVFVCAYIYNFLPTTYKIVKRFVTGCLLLKLLSGYVIFILLGSSHSAILTVCTSDKVKNIFDVFLRDCHPIPPKIHHLSVRFSTYLI